MRDNKEELCTVCSMKTASGKYMQKYHKMNFHLCSEHCRQTFQAHPRLHSGKRAKDVGEVIKCSLLRLAQPLDPCTAQLISEYLQALMGAKEVYAVDCWLLIHYEPRQLTLAQIESTLNEVDIQLENSWWQKLWRARLCNTDNNEFDKSRGDPRRLIQPSAAYA